MDHSSNIYAHPRANDLSLRRRTGTASCAQIQPTWQFVSLPNGAAGAKRAIQQNIQFLQGYEEIVLFFDNDDAGRKAAADAASVLPPG